MAAPCLLGNLSAAFQRANNIHSSNGSKWTSVSQCTPVFAQWLILLLLRLKFSEPTCSLFDDGIRAGHVKLGSTVHYFTARAID